MNYLLDTHTVLWYMGDAPNIPAKTKELIDDNRNGIFVSSVSLWETAIKYNLGKMRSNLTLDGFLGKIERSDFKVLQIKNEHLRRLLAVPFIHKDPFDRLLISTALVENLTIITADANIQKYDVPWIW